MPPTKTAMNKYICFVAGHSGGHITPCATQAKNELESNPNLKIIFFTTSSKLDKKILENYSFIDKKIYLNLKNLPRKIYLYPTYFIKMGYSFFQILFYLNKFRPVKIVSMGGIVSIPVCIAGKILGIPIEIYELNIEPGKAVNLIVKIASTVNICFKETANYFPSRKCNLVGYPIRFNDSNKLSQPMALQKINFFKDRKTLLIVGGSQGSVFINNLIKNFIESNEKIHNNLQVIHQTGTIDKTKWQDYYAKYQIPAIIFDYTNKIENFYCAADLIICRSGAGTLAEILFFNKKCITIPLETKITAHQVKNAQNLAQNYPNLFYMEKQIKIENDKNAFFNVITRKLYEF